MANFQQASRVQEQLRFSLAPAIEAMQADWARLLPAFQRAFSLLARSIPPNWGEGDLGPRIDLAARGWPIVWLPNEDVVNELVAAQSEGEREDVLLRRSSDILDDAE